MRETSIELEAATQHSNGVGHDTTLRTTICELLATRHKMYRICLTHTLSELWDLRIQWLK